MFINIINNTTIYNLEASLVGRNFYCIKQNLDYRDTLLKPFNDLQILYNLINSRKVDFYKKYVSQVKRRIHKKTSLGEPLNLIVHIQFLRANIFITITTVNRGFVLFKITPKILKVRLRKNKTQPPTVVKLSHRIVNLVYMVSSKRRCYVRIYFYKVSPIWWVKKLMKIMLKKMSRVFKGYVFLKSVHLRVCLAHNGCRERKPLHRRRGRAKRSTKRITNAKRGVKNSWYKAVLETRLSRFITKIPEYIKISHSYNSKDIKNLRIRNSKKCFKPKRII